MTDSAQITPFGGLHGSGNDKTQFERIAELERDLSAAREWREAVLNELIVAHIYTKEHDTNPRKAIQDAITWNCQVALDPAVSSDAQKLIAAAQETRERAEERAAACKKDAERWKKYLEIYDSEELAEAAWGGAGEITKTVDAAIDAARTP